MAVLGEIPRERGLTVRCRLAALGAIAVLAAGCGGAGGDGGGAAAPAPTEPAGPAAMCIVRLHGKGSSGAPSETVDDRRIVAPDGNAEGWNGRQWLYDTPERFDAGVAIVTAAADGCARVVVHGFSNGGAFAGKLFCRGIDLGGRLAGVIVDDPVTDNGVVPCAPAAGVEVALYWTGALAADSAPGGACGPKDWTCEGGTTIGIDAYAAALGVPATASPHDDHRWHFEAPELTAWT
jgi:hypothetical protein